MNEVSSKINCNAWKGVLSYTSSDSISGFDDEVFDTFITKNGGGSNSCYSCSNNDIFVVGAGVALDNSLGGGKKQNYWEDNQFEYHPIQKYISA